MIIPRLTMALMSLLILGGAFTVVPVQAQGLEEIVVVARKKPESLQDVPVSIQAYNGEFISEQGYVGIQDMAGSIPNFSYSQAVGAGDVLVMRGLGTVGSGPHLEQAVGQVFNGYFTTRARLGRAALVDVNQVELLRGPQGPIIGKNTSLGAIVVTPNKPTEETELEVSAGYEFKGSAGYSVQGIASGAISDSVLGRVVIDYKDKDGWVENGPSGDDHRKKDDLTVRGILDITLSDKAELELLYQHSNYDREGKPRELLCVDPARVFANANFAGEDCRINARNNSYRLRSLAAHEASVNYANGVTPGTYSITQTQDLRIKEGFELDSDVFGATIGWDFSDNWTLTSVTSYLEYEMDDGFDSDLTANTTGRAVFAVRSFENFEGYEQFTQEVRVVGNAGETDWIAGVNYFSSELDFTQDFDHHSGGPGGRFPNGRRHEEANVETDSISMFAQADWRLSDSFRLTTGARYTSEERDGFKDQWQNIYGTATRSDELCSANQNSGLFGCFANAITGKNDGPLTGDVDDSNVSWNVSLQNFYSDRSMLYVSAATGFKSQGFNIRGNDSRAAGRANFVFDEEESLSFELGGKHELLDDAMRFNWTLYHTTIDGLQLASNDPINISQAVVNGEASATGLEWDVLWLVSESFELGFNGAFTNTEYDDFLGACWNVAGYANGNGGRQSFADGCDSDGAGNKVVVTDPLTEEGSFQNLNGEQPPFAPDFTMALTGAYTVPVGANMELEVKGRVYVVDDQELSVTNHPFASEDGYTKVDLTIGLADLDGSWSVALVGRNLTNELVRTWSEPTSSYTSVGGATFSFIDETRSYALRFRYSL